MPRRLKQHPIAPEQRHATAIAAVLALILVLVVALTWQAWHAARGQRAIADAALADQATFAARSYQSRVSAQIYSALATSFRGLATRRADNPPAPATIWNAVEAAIRCHCEPVIGARYAFRIDLDTGDIVTTGLASPAPEEQRWLTRAVRDHAHHMADDAWPFALFFVEAGERAMPIGYLTVHDRAGRSRWAMGFVSTLGALERDVFGLQYRAAPLFVAARSDSLARDSVITVSVHLASGAPIYRSPVQHPEHVVGRAAVAPFLGSLGVAVALNPRAANHLLPAGAPSLHLPLLGVLVVVTAILLGCAVVLMFRATRLARQRAEFTASVSHELRTPLAQIMLFAETMAHGRLASVRDYRREANVILQEGRRLLHLVENVLHFARAERIAIPLDAKPQLLGPVVRGVVLQFAPLAGESDLVIRTAIDDTLGAHVDAHAVARALGNLLENALKYGGAGQQIIVGVALENGEAVIRVDDRGPGVPAAQRERVWRPFTRLERDVGRAVTGSGIGLAIVRDIVHRHRGRVWVEESPLGGARFVMAFPAAWQTDRPVRANEPASSPAGERA